MASERYGGGDVDEEIKLWVYEIVIDENGEQICSQKHFCAPCSLDTVTVELGISQGIYTIFPVRNKKANRMNFHHFRTILGLKDHLDSKSPLHQTFPCLEEHLAHTSSSLFPSSSPLSSLSCAETKCPLSIEYFERGLSLAFRKSNFTSARVRLLFREEALLQRKYDILVENWTPFDLSHSYFTNGVKVSPFFDEVGNFDIDVRRSIPTAKSVDWIYQRKAIYKNKKDDVYEILLTRKRDRDSQREKSEEKKEKEWDCLEGLGTNLFCVRNDNVILTAGRDHVLPGLAASIALDALQFDQKEKEKGEKEGNKEEFLSSLLLQENPKKGQIELKTKNEPFGPLKLEIRPPTLEEVFSAKELFICSASRTLVPVVKVDERTIGNGKPGDLFQWWIQNYHSLLELEGKQV